MTRLRFVALSLLAVAATAAALVAVPPVARVTDLTGTLDAGQRQALEQRLAAFEARKGSQVVVLVVPTTQPEEIEQYGIRVMDAWKVGRKGVDDGVIVLVAKDDRRMRIEVGYGLEGPVPDAIAKRIIEETIKPYFKAGDFYGGISAGVDQLIHVIDGEPLPEPQGRGRGVGANPESFLGTILSALFFAFGVGVPAARKIGALPTAAVTGGVLGTVAGLLLAALIPGVVVGVVMFLISLAIYSAKPGGGRSGRGWEWRSGGGGGWSSRGGGGFSGGGGGGFSGGGGGGGGGGASGSW